MKKLFMALMLPFVLMFSGCYYAGSYSSIDYGKKEILRKGIIVGISDVDTSFDDMIAGGAVGTALGMAAGHSPASSAGFGITGAMFGNFISKNNVEHIVVRLESGDEIAFLHKKVKGKRLFAGDPVRVHFDEKGVVRDVTYAHGTVTRYKVL
jgi:outer membrane lipoprotein SlyB